MFQETKLVENISHITNWDQKQNRAKYSSKDGMIETKKGQNCSIE